MSAPSVTDWLTSFTVWSALTIVVTYVVLFKILSRWPRLERWFVSAALIFLPLASVFWIGSTSALVTTAGLVVLWWVLKTKTSFLASPAAATTARQVADSSRAEAFVPAPPLRPTQQTENPKPPKAQPEPSSFVRREAIFISYRRQDSADVTGRIYDRLVQRFGREQVFKDVDSIPLGVDFRAHLGNVVGRCNFLLVVIGPQWLSVSGENGRRLEDKNDFVRVEVESALARDIPVIPILVGGASLPADSELPPSLGAIPFRNGIRVRPDPDFHRDMDRLIAGLEQHASG
jgi:hypothetical protein